MTQATPGWLPISPDNARLSAFQLEWLIKRHSNNRNLAEAIDKYYAVYHCLSTFPAQAVYLPGSWDFRIRSTESIVFQLRVVAGAPKSLSIWPR
jgi:hypothetical protein